ncbi:MAG: hypothetical protein JXB85_08640 [Anaerolineales bacterium]|nr:hypothetical protein [Anaerolineales bacterium]
MEKKTKTILIIVGVVAGICILACIVGYFTIGKLFANLAESIEMDPAQAAAAAHAITDYDLPPGYHEQMAMDIGLYEFVVIGPESYVTGRGLMIMLAQFGDSSSLSSEDMAEQLRRSFEQQSGQPGLEMRVVETRTMVIRDAQTEVVILEGSANTGSVYRQLMTVFPGKDGQAMLMVQGIAEDWDEDLIFDFIRSLR